MTYSHPKHSAVLRAAGIALAAVLLLPTAAQADDRDLLRESSEDPYLFIILDTSGSMHWSPPCSQALFNAGECSPLCPEGDCYVPLNGDDQGSKFHQAKDALYEVLKDADGVRLGFATYNQDHLKLIGKHWLYKLAAGQTGITIPSSSAVYPAAGSTQVFGRPFSCTSGDTVGHDAGDPATFSDAWALERTHRCAQLDQTGSTASSGTQLIYLRNPANTTTYRFQFRNKLLQILGSTSYTVTLRLERCNNGSCSNRTFIQDKDLQYTLVSDFNMWDNAAKTTNPQLGYFGQGAAADSPSDNTCAGWDPNTDSPTDADSTTGYNIRFPTVNHPVSAFRPTLNRGDVIPLDWNDDHKDEILGRLAPNRLLGEAIPDFRTARYFQDSPLLGALRLRNPAARPFVAFGSTPLGNSMANFRTWYSAFKSLGGANDPDWACRQKYVLVLTDGDDTCGTNNPCTIASQLETQDNVLTYVVGFGLNDENLNPNNKLRCMATAPLPDADGDGDREPPAPILPQNKDQLVAALRAIVDNLRGQAAAFAAAAVPSIQAEVEEKIFLSSFTPLNNKSTWDGHVDAFLKPIPDADQDGKPDKDPDCGPDVEGGCHLWDAGEVLLTQAPDETEVSSGNLRLGNAADQRRVFYPKAKNLGTEAVPNDRSLFEFPTTATARQDLWDGMGLSYELFHLALPGSPPDVLANKVIGETLVEKTGSITIDGEATDITYVLGDIFHANPTLVDRPDDFAEFATNRYHDDSDANGQTCTAASPGYRCFARKHEFRRKMLAVGANDGMLHFFDAGIWDDSAKKFDNGTGKELFSFIPRMVLPILKEVATGERQIFSVDGSPRMINVFIDPAHSSGDPVDPADRRWRTVAIGGLREGGSIDGGGEVDLDNGKPFVSGYYALDVTQPDRLGSDNKPVNRDVVPTCISNYNASACGPIPFGAELWEFTDSVDGSPAEWGVSFDEDDNGVPDLGRTWSQPIIGRVRLADGSGGTAERWVAILGGGFDPENRLAPKSGTWLYMIDIETGKAIYKRATEGAVPSSPAAIDLNSDGFLDTLYVGTTAGYMYKVDLSVPQELEEVEVQDLNGVEHEVERVTGDAWAPFKIFDTLSGGQRLPIFFAPTVLLVAETGQFALVFGSGNREEMWNLTGAEGRLYVVADEGFTRAQALAGTLPKLETGYRLVDSEGAGNDGENFLLRPPPNKGKGFIITLDANERVVAQVFSVSGVTIFPTFKPQIVTDENAVCARTGDSRVFLVLSTNGDAIQPEQDGATLRYMNVGETLVTPPYVDQGASGNSQGGVEYDEEELEWRKAVLATLKQLFPPRSRFANYTVEVMFRRADTGEVRPIPIPIGIVEKNWKEF